MEELSKKMNYVPKDKKQVIKNINRKREVSNRREVNNSDRIMAPSLRHISSSPRKLKINSDRFNWILSENSGKLCKVSS